MNIEGYPLPIFSAYQEYESAVSQSDIFRSLMRLFTTILKYCSITVVADYLVYLENEGKPDIQLTNLLYSNLFRPSLGHWNHFLRDLLVFRRKRSGEEESGFFFDLDAAYFKKRNKTTPGKAAILFNEMISVRNEWFHPGLDPDESNAPGLVADVESKLGLLLENLEFLKQYPLFHYHEAEKHLLMGDISSQWTESDIAQLSPKERQLFLEIGNDKTIALNFLIELKSSKSGDDHQFMLFETARINRKKSIKLVKFILGNKWGFDEELYLDLANEVQTLLRIEQKEEIVEVADLSWSHLYSLSQNLLKENRRNLEESGKVIPSVYIKRASIEGEDGFFEQFMDDKKSRCLLILGDSGHGKTNTLWKLVTHPILREKKNDLCSFFFEARNIHPEGIKKEVDQVLFLDNSLLSVIKKMKENDQQFAGKDVVFFIDAINEYSDPKSLMREILDLFPREESLDFRFIVSCRSISWSRILVSLTNQQEELVYSYQEDGEKKYPTLVEYSEIELQSAYANYCDNFNISTALSALSPRSQKLVKDPLMLRLTAEAYSGSDPVKGTIPRQLNISRIFEKYDAKAHIDDQRDEPFLANLIEQMWQLHRSNVVGEEIRKFDKLQEIVYATPVNLALGSTYQCGSCKRILNIGDPDFEVGDPCPSCDSMNVKPVQKDWRTTYERLLDEGIVTEDLQADDMALRFVYDRYYEYRTARWILEKFNPLNQQIVEKLVDHAHLGDAPILLEAIKLAVRLCSNCENIILALAGSEKQERKDMAESIIIAMIQSSENDKGKSLILTLVNADYQKRIIAINVAVEIADMVELADISDIVDIAFIKEIPKKEGNEAVSSALSRALYLIWRKSPERAIEIMEKLREQISYSNFVKHGFSLFSVLLEVTFKVLGVLHHKNEIVKTLGNFWIKLITQNLRLAKKGLLNGILSKSVKMTLINSLSLFGNALFKKHGVSFGKGDKAFTEAEKQSILKILDAWHPGAEAINLVSDIILKYGPDSLIEEQRKRICSTIVVFFGIPACVAAMNHNPQSTISIYDRTYKESAALHDKGRTTRFFTYSGVNFALQLNYPKMDDTDSGSHPLTSVYDTLHNWYLQLLEEDPEIFVRAEIIAGTPNSSFGIFSQAAARMGADLIEDLVKPMLAKAENGYPGLLKSYLRNSLFSLDTFSSRVSAHLVILKTYDYLLSIPDLSEKIGMDKKEMINLFVEAYAIISVGYPSDVELFVIGNKKIPAGFMELIRQARNKPSQLFDQMGQQTMEQYINSTLQAWTISDGGNSMLANFPQMRGIIDKYFRDAVACGDLADVLAQAVKDLFDFLVDQGRKI